MESAPGAEPSGDQKNCELAARIRAGDSLAEKELVTIYRRPLLLIASSRIRDREDANDLAQEILAAHA